MASLRLSLEAAGVRQTSARRRGLEGSAAGGAASCGRLGRGSVGSAGSRGAEAEQRPHLDRRPDSLSCSLEESHEDLRGEVRELRRGLAGLRRELRAQGEEQRQQQEATLAAFQQGDRALAGELLGKMGELNRKLGTNMQALEDELTSELRSQAASDARGTLREALEEELRRAAEAPAELLQELRAELDGVQEAHRGLQALSRGREEEVEELRAASGRASQALALASSCESRLEASLRQATQRAAGVHAAALELRLGDAEGRLAALPEALRGLRAQLPELWEEVEVLRQDARRSARRPQHRQGVDSGGAECSSGAEPGVALADLRGRVEGLAEQLAELRGALAWQASHLRDLPRQGLEAQMALLEDRLEAVREAVRSDMERLEHQLQECLARCTEPRGTGEEPVEEKVGKSLQAWGERRGPCSGEECVERLREESRVQLEESSAAAHEIAERRIDRLRWDMESQIDRSVEEATARLLARSEAGAAGGEPGGELGARLVALEERISAAQGVARGDALRLERLQEAQGGELAGLHRSMGRISGDILKLQGACSEVTRQDWPSALEASAAVLRREWQAEAERLSAQLCRAKEEQRQRLDEVQLEVCSLAERCEGLARETQRQCRVWVAGALRRLETLAVRTRERCAALSAEIRDEPRLGRCRGGGLGLSTDGP